jgi:hypothetical protein
MDVKGAAFTGAPPEDWPAWLALALFFEAIEDGRAEAAFPGEQAEAVAAVIIGIVVEGGGTARVSVGPRRLGWYRVTLDLTMPESG